MGEAFVSIQGQRRRHSFFLALASAVESAVAKLHLLTSLPDPLFKWGEGIFLITSGGNNDDDDDMVPMTHYAQRHT